MGFMARVGQQNDMKYNFRKTCKPPNSQTWWARPGPHKPMWANISISDLNPTRVESECSGSNLNAAGQTMELIDGPTT